MTFRLTGPTATFALRIKNMCAIGDPVDAGAAGLITRAIRSADSESHLSTRRLTGAQNTIAPSDPV